MVNLIMMIILSAVATGTNISYSRQPRFILNSYPTNPYNQMTPGGQFCTICPIQCINGYVTSSRGCLLCQCKFVASQSGTQAGSSPTSYTGPYRLPKPCQPHRQYCNLRCSAGLQRGQNGCQFCACANSTTTPIPYLISTIPTITKIAPNTTVNYQPHEVLLSNPCYPHIRYCNRQCVHGLRRDPIRGCQYCACAGSAPTKTTISTGTVPVTTIKPTTSTTPPPHNNKNYIDPCIPSQTTCNKDCGGEYIKGPQGCQYCLCLARVPHELRPTTTIAPVTPFGSLPQNQTGVPAHLMSEACTVAKAICQFKCPNGFISKPDDCLYCECHQKTTLQGDDLADEQGFMLKLPNPCVQGMDRCEILCRSGYLLGPRNCVYCTCRA